MKRIALLFAALPSLAAQGMNPAPPSIGTTVPDGWVGPRSPAAQPSGLPVQAPYPIGDADMVATVAAFEAVCRSVKSGRTEIVEA